MGNHCGAVGVRHWGDHQALGKTKHRRVNEFSIMSPKMSMYAIDKVNGDGIVVVNARQYYMMCFAEIAITEIRIIDLDLSSVEAIDHA
jgi:hypothetical protein